MSFRKSFFITLFAFALFSATAEIPSELKGIWSAKDRIVFLDDGDCISVILKEYYGWYYDRAVEPAEHSELLERKRNLATQKHGYEYSVNFNRITEKANVWEMEITIDKKTKSIIPVALIDDKLYLNFLLKVPYDEEQEMDTEEELETNPFYGYWQGLNCNDSIRICPRNNIENLISWYITETGVYRLRFWQSKMLHEDSKAVFSDNNKLFTINKHIFSAGTNYSCVSGRSSNIRNVEKYADFPFQYTLDSTGNIMALGSHYLTKLQDKETAEELMKIVKKANSRRKPDPEPIFPVKLPKILEKM